jgi:type II secretory pathway pseudopilin PulG
MSLSKKKKDNGFTLVEVLVSMSIVVTILGVIVMNQSTYTTSSTLASIADHISLTLSEAQVYGVSVKEVTPGSNNFSAAYGVEFSLVSNSGSNDAYIFYADTDNSGTYDRGWSCSVGGISECISKTVLQTGYTVSTICEIPLSGAEVCGPGKVDITFARPNTDAKIAYFDSAGNPITFPSPKGARITLVSPTNKTLSVVVYNTGQISVQ